MLSNFKVGLREIKNQTLELTFPHFPVAPYGKYLFTVNLVRGGEVVGSTSAECELVPRL